MSQLVEKFGRENAWNEHIVLVNPLIEPLNEGFKKSSYNFIKALEASGVPMKVIQLGTFADILMVLFHLNLGNFACIHIIESHTIMAPLLLKLRKIIRREKYTIIQYILSPIHCQDRIRNKILRILTYLISLVFSDIVITTSVNIKRKLSRCAHMLKRSILLIPMPISTNKYEPPHHKWEGNKLRVLYIGELGPFRFPEKVVLGFVSCLTKIIPMELTVVTADFQWNYVYMKSFLKEVKDMGLLPHIKAKIKDLSETEKAELYSQAHVFLFPALAPAAMDPPLTALESLSHGTPVILFSEYYLSLLNIPGTISYIDFLRMSLNNAAYPILLQLKLVGLEGKRYVEETHTIDSVAKILGKLVVLS